MAFVTGDVVPNPGGESPFKVVFKQGETVLAEWPVASQQEGEEQIAGAIRGLMEEGEEHEEGEGDDEGHGEEDDDRDDRSDRNQRGRGGRSDRD